MSYELIFSPIAEEDWKNLPEELRADFTIRLNELAEHPTRNSRPSLCPPYWPNHQMREFSIESNGRMWYCVILFKYMDNETELWIAALGSR